MLRILQTFASASESFDNFLYVHNISRGRIALYAMQSGHLLGWQHLLLCTLENGAKKGGGYCFQRPLLINKRSGCAMDQATYDSKLQFRNSNVSWQVPIFSSHSSYPT